ncbi:hypothetical protein GCM10009547_08850 [Sporichthya brevicatena]|uniref:Uncharacterized protein n=1 Tax=Sporichthya brevicatena TaxID=171442 RepID=A0ABN1GD96_9ACTN
MNTLIGMPEPAVDNVVAEDPVRAWTDRWLGWVSGVSALLVLVAATVGTTLWLTRDTDVHLGIEPEWRFDPVIVSRAAPEFSSSALYLDETDREISIISVTPLTTANVQYIGARAIWPNQDVYGNWQVPGRGFPRPQVKVSHPVTERIPAHITDFHDENGLTHSVRLVAGFRLVSGDIGAVNGIEVVYRDGDSIVRKVFRVAALACFEREHCVDDNEQDLVYTPTLDELGLVRSG